MTEPPEVFQRDVLRRHALPDQLDDQAAHPGDPTAVRWSGPGRPGSWPLSGPAGPAGTGLSVG
ncbi:hypothetical protein [Nonomuraea sp. NPDC049709]|uniref:hypothetical protein n=1 Tax=Nonomuraea sp. NPDC049709 TaxID=3154736 RepID=UPI0034136036